MARSLRIDKPHAREVRQLLALVEKDLRPRQYRRAEAILLYATGMSALDIADALEVHPNTVYTDLHAYATHGVAAVHQLGTGGTPARITPDQLAEIFRLANQPPYALNLPYGRWTLTTLRDYLLKQKIVKSISREHLRRVLLKRGCASDVCGASSSVPTLREQRFWPVFAKFGDTCQLMAY